MCSDLINLANSCYIDNWALIASVFVRVFALGIFIGTLVGIVSNISQSRN